MRMSKGTRISMRLRISINIIVISSSSSSSNKSKSRSSSSSSSSSSSIVVVVVVVVVVVIVVVFYIVVVVVVVVAVAVAVSISSNTFPKKTHGVVLQHRPLQRKALLKLGLRKRRARELQGKEEHQGSMGERGASKQYEGKRSIKALRATSLLKGTITP